MAKKPKILKRPVFPPPEMPKGKKPPMTRQDMMRDMAEKMMQKKGK